MDVYHLHFRVKTFRDQTFLDQEKLRHPDEANMERGRRSYQSATSLCHLQQTNSHFQFKESHNMASVYFFFYQVLGLG